MRDTCFSSRRLIIVIILYTSLSNRVYFSKHRANTNTFSRRRAALPRYQWRSECASRIGTCASAHNNEMSASAYTGNVIYLYIFYIHLKQGEGARDHCPSGHFCRLCVIWNHIYDITYRVKNIFQLQFFFRVFSTVLNNLIEINSYEIIEVETNIIRILRDCFIFGLLNFDQALSGILSCGRVIIHYT